MSIRTRLIFAISLLIGLMFSQLYISITITETKFMVIFSILIACIAMLILWWQIIKYITSGIKVLQQAISQATEGNFAGISEIKTQDEFAHLASSINAMLTSLEYTRKENNHLLEEALLMKEEKIDLLKYHLSQVVKVQEAERKRVSRELHDQAGQALLAIQLGLGRLEKYMNIKAADEEIAALRDITQRTIQDIKNLALDLRPSMLDELGLIPTIRQYAKDFSRRSGINVELNVPPNTADLSAFNSDLATTLFRIIQEGLTNVVKHAQADQVYITLRNTETFLDLIIEDNGIGFNVTKALTKQQKECVGLFGMKERVSLWHGNLEIKSSPDEGTTLMITIPLK